MFLYNKTSLVLLIYLAPGTNPVAVLHIIVVVITPTVSAGDWPEQQQLRCLPNPAGRRGPCPSWRAPSGLATPPRSWWPPAWSWPEWSKPGEKQKHTNIWGLPTVAAATVHLQLTTIIFVFWAFWNLSHEAFSSCLWHERQRSKKLYLEEILIIGPRWLSIEYPCPKSNLVQSWMLWPLLQLSCEALRASAFWTASDTQESCKDLEIPQQRGTLIRPKQHVSTEQDQKERKHWDNQNTRAADLRNNV